MTVPIFTHTHWDREWFERLGSTIKLLEQFFVHLFQKIDENPKLFFILDGQTVMITDFLSALPWKEKKLAFSKLKNSSDSISLGPFYGQIDWRIAEESALMNLEIGLKQARIFGTPFRVGWLVDNFGFCSQLPQILQEYGIPSVVVWRGISLEKPQIDFYWKSPDNSTVRGLYVLDSYRNLMRLGDFPDVCAKRIQLVVERLKPYSISGILPLFDGYDLDPNPEDPADFGDYQSVNPELSLKEDSGVEKSTRFCVVKGEQQNGKIACTFPGSLSTRIYLKQMHSLLEDMLSKVLQPLNSLVWIFGGHRQFYQQEWQIVLQNLIHDSIAGVGSDAVHQEMENRYSFAFSSCKKNVDLLLERLSPFFTEGYYAWNLQPSTSKFAWVSPDRYALVDARGGSLTPIQLSFEHLSEVNEPISSFVWENPFFALRTENGALTLYRAGVEKKNIRFYLLKDSGDCYSSAFMDEIPFTATTMMLYKKSACYSAVKILFQSEVAHWEWEIGCDQTPVIKMRVGISAHEKSHFIPYGLLLSINGEGTITAHTPFDRIERDSSWFYDEPSSEWRPFLVAARETGKITEFSFKDFVGYQKGEETVGWLAKGVYSYSTHKGLGLILKRCVNYLSKPEVPGRSGDAGPLMYTPQAGVNRKLDFDLGLFCGKTAELPAWKNGAIAPPLLLESTLKIFSALPLSMKFYEGSGLECTTAKPFRRLGNQRFRNVLFRFFNSHESSAALKVCLPAHRVKLDGSEPRSFNGIIEGKKIASVVISFAKQNEPQPCPRVVRNDGSGSLRLLFPSTGWNGFRNIDSHSFEVPEPLEIEKLKKLAALYRQKAQQCKKSTETTQSENYTELFEYYKAMRTALEIELSIIHNTKKTDSLDAEILQVFSELNQLRIQRRSIELLLEALRQGGESKCQN